MSALAQKSNQLRNQLPKNGGATPPQMKGVLLGKLQHKDGEIRLVWDSYEGHSFLSIRLWTSDDGATFWPSKTGFTVKLRDVASLGDAVSKALDLALQEVKANPPATSTFEGTDLF